LACAKHFAGYGFPAESGRDYNTVDVSETTLQNTIFSPLKQLLMQVRTFMNSFNELNGIPATKSILTKRNIKRGIGI
jgi:beta-glucosidase